MPSCAVVDCFNNDTKGFKMKRFPSDPVRRKVWVEKVNRKNWSPNSSSRLCEAHFTSDMFEQHRADGLIKLKWNAVPTIFPISVDDVYSPVLLSLEKSTNETLTKQRIIQSNEDKLDSEDNVYSPVLQQYSCNNTIETLTHQLEDSNKRCKELLRENDLLNKQLNKVHFLLKISEEKNKNYENNLLRKNTSHYNPSHCAI